MSENPSLPKLTPKQDRFVDAYVGIARFNASEAARLAGYSRKTAGEKGYELKNIQAIRAHIDFRLNAESLSAPEVLKRLTDVANADWRDFITVLEYDDAGRPLKTKMDLTAHVKALELLGKGHQLFSDHLKVSGRVDHVHRSPAIQNLTDDELDNLTEIAGRIAAEAS